MDKRSDSIIAYHPLISFQRFFDVFYFSLFSPFSLFDSLLRFLRLDSLAHMFLSVCLSLSLARPTSQSCLA